MDPLLAGIAVFIVTFLVLLIFVRLFSIDFGADSRPEFNGSVRDH